MRKAVPDGGPSNKFRTTKASKLLDVYIRNNKKQALLVHTPHSTSLHHLTSIISHRFRVPAEAQLLFHNGLQLKPSLHCPEVELEDKVVIHLVDRRNIQRQITINVRRLNLDKVEQFKIPSAQIIEDFIVRNIKDEEPQKIFFVYTGRQLNKDQSFEEEFVENGSQLFCLHEDNDEVKGERREELERRGREDRVKRQWGRKKAGVRRGEEDELDGGLWNYLPKEKERKRLEENSEPKYQNQSEVTKPNFKKKICLKEMKLSGGSQANKRSTSGDENLSLVTENVENTEGGVHSTYFNEGSSISQIIPDYKQSPQCLKKIEEDSVFQRAIMGLENQHSQVPSRVSESNIPEEDDLNGSNEGGSFSFDARAPELIPLEQPDRQLAVIERQILEEIESQELSEDDQKLQNKGKYENKSLVNNNLINQEKSINSHQQFDLGDAENHLLSASAEMKVPEQSSPTIHARQNNEILIEDEQNQEIEVGQSEKVEDRKQSEVSEGEFEYVGVQVHRTNHNQGQQDNFRDRVKRFIMIPPRQQRKSIKDSLQFLEEKSNETPFFVQNNDREKSGEQLDLFIIEQTENQQSQTPADTPTQSQIQDIIEEKQEVQTHGHSSNSNFYSKNSSRFRQQFGAQPNQYQSGQYTRPPNRPTTQSGCYQNNSYSQQNLLETPRSQQNDKSNSVLDGKAEQSSHHNDSEDLELQIVDLPFEIKALEHVEILMSYDESQIAKSKVEEKEITLQKQTEKPQTESFQKAKEGSKIDQLNNLMSEEPPFIQQYSEADEVKESNLLSDDSYVKQARSETIVDTSLAKKGNEPQVEVVGLESKKYQHENIEQVQLRKTIIGLSEASKIEQEQTLKLGAHKENFPPGHFIFKNEIVLFNPLQFYIGLLEQERQTSNEQIG